MKKRYLIIGTIAFILGALIATAAVVLAGNPDSPGDPASTSSYNLEDIYNRLDNGAAGAESTFQEPLSGPGPTGRTINEIMGIAPIVDDTYGAVAADVADGKTFWGLSNGAWGLQAGTLVPIPDTDNDGVPDCCDACPTEVVNPDGLGVGDLCRMEDDPGWSCGQITELYRNSQGCVNGWSASGGATGCTESNPWCS